MEIKRIYLIDGREDIYLDAYIADKTQDYTRRALLIIPGGAYHIVCSQWEGEPVAHAFMPYGYNAFVLHYSVGGKGEFPDQLVEASLAMKHIRDNAEEYGINPDEVYVAGFSAGGHLACSLGTLWHRKEICDKAGIKYGENKPKGMLLLYPVVSVNAGHQLTFNWLLNTEEPTAKQLEEVSLDRFVDSHTVPSFICHTANDPVVSVKHSLMFASKLAELEHKFEMHIFPDGPHGLAVANEITWRSKAELINEPMQQWVDLAAKWIKRLDE